LTLTLFTSARAADEVVLEWTPDPRAERWQYRLKDLRDRRWTEWRDISHSNARTSGHRVDGLLTRHVYRFQVRPWTADGPGEPSAHPELFTEYGRRLGREIVGKPETADGIVSGENAGLLERGGTFRPHGGSPYTFTVPRTGLWVMQKVISEHNLQDDEDILSIRAYLVRAPADTLFILVSKASAHPCLAQLIDLERLESPRPLSYEGCLRGRPRLGVKRSGNPLAKFGESEGARSLNGARGKPHQGGLDVTPRVTRTASRCAPGSAS